MADNDKLFIPDKIRIGYQERDDTYSKKLGFVIAYDQKGKLRQEQAWKGWIKHDLGDFDNTPIEGFVLNRDVGGVQRSYSWHGRREKVRVFDPRGFEFEISVETLLFILQEATSTKGKGLEGEFVYAWSGKNIGIIPVNSHAYQKSVNFTKAQKASVKVKDLILGCIYQTKQTDEVIYLGKFNYADRRYEWSSTFEITKGHVFVKKNHLDEEDKWVCYTSPQPLAYKLSDSPVENYAELMDEFNDSVHVVGPRKFNIEKADLTPRDLNYYDSCPLEGTFFREIDKGVRFEAYNVTQEAEVNPSYRWGYGLNSNTRYFLKGYRLVPVGTVDLSNHLLIIDSKKGDTKVLSPREVDALDLKQITVKGVKGKECKLKVK